MVSKAFIVTALAALASALPTSSKPDTPVSAVGFTVSKGGLDTIDLAKRDANALVAFYTSATAQADKRDEDFYIPPWYLQPHDAPGSEKREANALVTFYISEEGAEAEKRDPNALVAFYVSKEAADKLGDLAKRSPNALVAFYVSEAEPTPEKRNELDAFYEKDAEVVGLAKRNELDAFYEKDAEVAGLAKRNPNALVAFYIAKAEGEKDQNSKRDPNALVTFYIATADLDEAGIDARDVAGQIARV